MAVSTTTVGSSGSPEGYWGDQVLVRMVWTVVLRPMDDTGWYDRGWCRDDGKCER